MIKTIVEDIFKVPTIDVIAHQANCYCTFGSGIAKTIREKYPAAYEADCKTKKGDLSKLGTFSSATIHDGDRKFVIANVYGQGGFGKRNHGGRDTNYDALYDGLSMLNKFMSESCDAHSSTLTLGIPYGIGCGLGGGSWKIVTAMLEDLFENNDCVNCIICRLQSQPEL